MGRSVRLLTYIVAALLAPVFLSACGGNNNATAVSSTNPVSFYGHSVAFKNTTTAMAWGYNGFYQLGNGNGLTLNSLVPGPVVGIHGASGIVAGGTHTLAFKNMSGVWAWGNNGFGQVGNGTTLIQQLPTPVLKVNPANPLLNNGPLTGVTAVAAGGNHSLAIASGGSIWAWGYNGYGQLGNNSGINSSFAVQLLDPALSNSAVLGATAIAAGGAHSMAIVSGTVTAWGNNANGQLGLDPASAGNSTSPFPIAVPGITGATAIAAGGSHSLALIGGKVWAWGLNFFGQLGTQLHDSLDTTTTIRYVFTPTAVNGPLATITINKIAAGLDHSLALASDGTVWAWGYNGYGQLGNGAIINPNPDPTPVPTPVQVMLNGVPLGDIVDILAIGNQSFAVTSTGKVYAWGDNRFGQLGDGTTASRSVPAVVNGVTRLRLQ